MNSIVRGVGNLKTKPLDTASSWARTNESGTERRISRVKPASRAAANRGVESRNHRFRTCLQNRQYSWFVSLLSILLCGCYSGEEEIRSQVDIPRETENLTSPDPTIRMLAAEALGSAGPKAVSAVDPLIEALRDPERGVRTVAATALMGIGPKAKKAVPALQTALQQAQAAGDREWIGALVLAINEIDPKAGKELKLPPPIGLPGHPDMPKE